MYVKIQQEYCFKCKECQSSSISAANLWAKQTTMFCLVHGAMWATQEMHEHPYLWYEKADWLPELWIVLRIEAWCLDMSKMIIVVLLRGDKSYFISDHDGKQNSEKSTVLCFNIIKFCTFIFQDKYIIRLHASSNNKTKISQ